MTTKDRRATIRSSLGVALGILLVIVGILSDTHGQAERAWNAVRLLERHGATAFVHCGDVGGESVLDALAGRKAWFVWGNTDVRDPAMQRYAVTLGITPPHGVPTTLELGARRIAVYHGHEHEFELLLRALSREDPQALRTVVGRTDVVLYGHTHVAADQRVGRVRMINPGALHRARPHTVATLDLTTDELRHWTVTDDPESSERYHLT